MLNFDWEKGFCLEECNAAPGSPGVTFRYLSQMNNMYVDKTTCENILITEDPLIYSFQELGAPDCSGDLSFSVSTVYPGKIGKEYYMTKGHFHNILNTAEVYYGLSGKGMILMENDKDDAKAFPLSPGQVVYVPKGYAHRSINTGKIPFSFFFVFRADAGHDYGTIEQTGFRKLILEENDRPVYVDNPKK
ncbi:MAG: cupin domain-containing protein [Lachnospiraceae bacterium]|nr:cupin domain-containing protein [Lachnospiraceae bacterium]